MDGHPPGVVGVIAQDTARFTSFAASLTGLEMPPGSQVVWKFGHTMAGNCNRLVEDFLADESKQWLWLLGDDHAFSPGILMRLLDHKLLLTGGTPDIVAPLCLTRVPPFVPTAFMGREGKHNIRIQLDDYPLGGLVQVHSSGSAGMLIRRHVFEAIERPWFEGYTLSTQEVAEDIAFCDKVREAGGGIWVDLDTVLGHCLSAVVWPVHEADGWTYGFSMMGGFTIRMPRPVG